MASSDLPTTFRIHILKRVPEVCGSDIAVAVSGGADSVALVHLLHGAAVANRLTLVHVHHGVRGADADRDADFVQRLAAQLGLPVDVRRLDDVPADHEGRESSWRRRRYEALERARRHHRARWIATAHQRDDVAEGVLMQMLRGAGPRAMAGIHRRCGRIVRPLLPFDHRDLVAFLTETGRSWREDASNADPEHLRNRVRQRILPQLEIEEPAVRRHLVRLAHDLAADERVLSRHVDALPDLRPWHPTGGVPVERMAASAGAVRARWLQRQSALAGLGRATRSQIQGLDAIIEGSERSVTLNRRWRLRRFAGALWLEPETPPAPWRRRIPAAGLVGLGLPGWRLTIRPQASSPPPGSPWRARIPTDTALQLCSVSALADPALRQHARQHLARHVPRHLRLPWPVLLAGAKILWIPGVLVSDEPRRPTAVAEVEMT